MVRRHPTAGEGTIGLEHPSNGLLWLLDWTAVVPDDGERVRLD
jgi:hypothetical protein